jgi:tetratricopeptide (TPR) repeat protein
MLFSNINTKTNPSKEVPEVSKIKKIPSSKLSVKEKEVITKVEVKKPSPQTQDKNKTLFYNGVELATKKIQSIKQSDENGTQTKEIVKEKKTENNETTKEEVKSFTLHVKQTSGEDILIRNFEVQKNYSSAISLAKFYFNETEYKKSIYWAKKASRINPQAVSPWLIYAKSKNKSGEKKEAIKALENYLSYFFSQEAQELLNRWKEEK